MRTKENGTMEVLRTSCNEPAEFFFVKMAKVLVWKRNSQKRERLILYGKIPLNNIQIAIRVQSLKDLNRLF